MDNSNRKPDANERSDSVVGPVSRRQFLKAVAAAPVLAIGFSLPAVGRPAIPIVDEAENRGSIPLGGFVRIDQVGQVTLVMPKVEMGQGVYTSIPMLLAEELEVPLDSVRLEHAPPDKAYIDPMLGTQITGGSTSTRYSYDSMRKAGATARTMLISAAAARWRIDPSSLRALNGFVYDARSGKRIWYGELVAAASKIPAPTSVRLKDPKDYKLIGRRIKRLDSPEKVNGSAVFGIDTRVPGMVYAAVKTCPVLGGKPRSVSDVEAKKVPGYQRFLMLSDAVVAIGVNTWAARRALGALKINWDEGANRSLSSAKIWADLRSAAAHDGAVAHRVGNPDREFAKAMSRIEASYEQPFLAHAPMEPLNCTAHVTDQGCEVWAGVQAMLNSADAASKVAAVPLGRVTVHNHLLGGGFGRRSELDFVTQATRIAKEIGHPVKVTWSREDDIQRDFYRPAYYDVISAALDAKGRPTAWSHKIVGSSVTARFVPPAFVNGVDLDAVSVATELPYDLPNQKITYVRQEHEGVQTGFWRGVGPGRSTFVVESFIDELAAKTKTDPVHYRDQLLSKAPRLRNVLARVSEAAASHGLPRSGVGRGYAVMNAFGSYLAASVDASVSNGSIEIHRVIIAVDCGSIVNPDTIEAQMHSGTIFGLSAALYGDITVKDGQIEQSNFHNYRVLRINEVPPIETHIIPSTEAAGGVGESATAIIPATLANALYAATGKRIRRLPIGDQLALA